LLGALCELFAAISSQRRRCGVHPPRRFVARLRAENEAFNNQMHQDAHEFLNYLLNEMADTLERRAKERREAEGRRDADAAPADAAAAAADDDDDDDDDDDGAAAPPPKTWVHALFEGQLANETRCLACDSVTSRHESFLDLSLEIEPDSSVEACLRNFAASEPMRGGDKFFCDECCSLQEARKRMRIARLPSVLALHLKRFKYVEQLGRFKKLSYRVAFPMELAVPAETVRGPAAADGRPPYRLFAVIVHAGSGPNHGHYVALVRTHGRWLCFDDDAVDVIDEAQVGAYSGAAAEAGGSTDTGYLLFYERAAEGEGEGAGAGAPPLPPPDADASDEESE
jgi:ubiquitin carboxyl-terminal hydrolase 12/46